MLSSAAYGGQFPIALISGHPTAIIRRTTSYAYGQTDTPITWSSAFTDPYGLFNAGTPTYITIPSAWAGVWFFSFYGTNAPSPPGATNVQARIRKNSSTASAFCHAADRNYSSTEWNMAVAWGFQRMAAGDTIYCNLTNGLAVSHTTWDGGVGLPHAQLEATFVCA